MTQDNFPPIDRLADLQQLIADFADIQRVPLLADKGRHENDVDHSFGLAMTCWFLAPKIAPHLNLEKILKYALAHDIVEIHAGDTFVFDKENLKTKSAREDKAIDQLKAEWPDFPEMTGTAKAYKDHADEEAKFVYVIDKILPTIMVTMNEKDAYFTMHKVTREMHEAEKQVKMTISPEGTKYFHMLNEWMDKLDYYYKES